MKNKIYIHTNDKQMLGALISAFSFKEFSKEPDRFDVEIINVKNLPLLWGMEGKAFLTRGIETPYDRNDLQSFTLARFSPPTLMNFQGKALVVDPDVFAVPGADANDLFDINMDGKNLFCVQDIQERRTTYRSSVMLLNNHNLKHWEWTNLIQSLFSKKIDYRDLMSLKLEDPSKIGRLDDGWNHYDLLNDNTKFIHYTYRLTQPWKTGLKVDFKLDPGGKSRIKFLPEPIASWIRQKLKPMRYSNTYQNNPSQNQIDFFFGLVKRALEKGFISSKQVDEEIKFQNVRKDIMKVIESTPNLRLPY